MSYSSEGGTPLYYFNPYSVYPYYHPQGIHTVPVEYVPSHFNEHLQPRNTLRPQRQYPDVNIQEFSMSTHKFQILMRQADLLVDKLGNDPEFAKQLMSAAQQSNKSKVNEMILSTGITINVKTAFTPTGIRITLNNAGFEGDCCNLQIGLNW